MKPASIADILRGIQRLPPVVKAERLREIIASEAKRSYRRAELESALKHIVNRDLQRANGVKH